MQILVLIVTVLVDKITFFPEKRGRIAHFDEVVAGYGNLGFSEFGGGEHYFPGFVV